MVPLPYYSFILPTVFITGSGCEPENNPNKAQSEAVALAETPHVSSIYTHASWGLNREIQQKRPRMNTSKVNPTETLSSGGLGLTGLARRLLELENDVDARFTLIVYET
jgi:hypothetical protein